MGVMVCMVGFGLVLWQLQRAWFAAKDKANSQLQTALLYSWGALLEKPPRDPSISSAGKVHYNRVLQWQHIVTVRDDTKLAKCCLSSKKNY